MTPFQAALKYAVKYAFSRKAGIRFAHEYENSANEADFDIYLDFIWGTKARAI